MKIHTLCAAAGTAISLLAIATQTRAATPTLILSEVAWGGTSKSTADEWIELANTGPEPVSLSGWTLEGVLSGGGVLSFPDATILPGSTYVIANYPAGHASTALAIAPDVSTTAVSLPNDGLRLILRHPDGSMADTAGDGGKPPAGISGSASMIRTDLTTWNTADTASGYAVGVPDLGTPGSYDTALIAVTDSPREEMPVTTEEEPVVVETPVVSLPIHVPPGSVVINEIFADPATGEDEWVEVYNPFVNTLPMAGWQIRDKGGAKTLLPEQYLGFGQYLVMRNPAGNLNNGSDLVELIGPDGTVVDSVVYGANLVPKSKKGQAVARQTDGTWALTDLATPGTENAFPIPVVVAAEVPVPAASTPAETLVQVPPPPMQDAAPISIALEPHAVGTFILSELYPNTGGNDVAEEFIEVRNVGTEDADFQGWRLNDMSKTSYIHKDETVLRPQESLALPRSLTKIALNNTGDTVRLSAPDQTERDAVTYGKAPKQHTYAKQADHAWVWTDPTPDEENAPPKPVPAAAVKKSAAPAPVRLSIQEASEAEDGTRVRISGTVTYVAGKIAYLRDETGGVRVDSSKAFMFTPGDTVTLSGSIGTAYSERRVRLGTKDAAQVVRSGEMPTAEPVTTLDESTIGRFVTFEGFLLSKSSASFKLELNGEEVAARPSSGTALTGITAGTRLRATGIAYVKDGAPALRDAVVEPVVTVPDPTPVSAPRAASGFRTFFARLFRRA